MKKTKLGVSVGLVGAALYFLGCVSIIPAFLLAGYVLLYEENAWLKKAAVRMLIVVVGFNIAYAGVGLIFNVVTILDLSLGRILDRSISVPLNLIPILRYIITFIQDAVLIIMGFKAFNLSNMKSDFLDKMIDKHMD